MAAFRVDDAPVFDLRKRSVLGVHRTRRSARVATREDSKIWQPACGNAPVRGKGFHGSKIVGVDRRPRRVSGTAVVTSD
jgi:hypothetical protein